MKNNFIAEIIISVILLSFLIVLLNPTNLFMTDATIMMILVFALIFFSLFAIVIFKEKSHDERESLHLMIAGRFAYLAGALTLIIGITIGELTHNLNPWLIYSLSAMIFAKIIGLIYAKLKH